MNVAYVRPLVTALKAMGSTVRYTEYPDGPHDITARVFESPELFRWLLAQHRSP
jgi:dipeptidyl aminopeptidase/acylaminoacyl peptidase